MNRRERRANEALLRKARERVGKIDDLLWAGAREAQHLFPWGQGLRNLGSIEQIAARIVATAKEACAGKHLPTTAEHAAAREAAYVIIDWIGGVAGTGHPWIKQVEVDGREAWTSRAVDLERSAPHSPHSSASDLIALATTIFACDVGEYICMGDRRLEVAKVWNRRRIADLAAMAADNLLMHVVEVQLGRIAKPVHALLGPNEDLIREIAATLWAWGEIKGAALEAFRQRVVHPPKVEIEAHYA